MDYIYSGITAKEARGYRAGAQDAYGNAPEHGISSGSGVPCRHCMRIVPEDAGFLLFAYRPFGALQPYAETGPIFICEAECNPPNTQQLPPVLDASPEYLIKGYTADERIKYGTGAIVSKSEIRAKIEELLDDPNIAFADVRSAKNNCWLTRVTRSL